MTPPPPLQPDDPKAWLRRAQNNLAYARHEVEGVLYEDPCFNAHQAAEKALKALLFHHEMTFPFTHEIKFLCIGDSRKGGVTDSPGWSVYTRSNKRNNTQHT